MKRQPPGFAALVLGLWLCGLPAMAAPPQAPPTASTADLRDLQQTLQDPLRRAELLSNIKALIALRDGARATARPHVKGTGGALVALLSATALHAGQAVAGIARLRPWRVLSDWWRQLAAEPALQARLARDSASVLGVVGLALLVWLAVRRGLRATTRRLRALARRRPSRRWLAGSGLCALSLVPPLALLAAGYALLAMVDAALGLGPVGRALALDGLNVLAVTRAIAGLVETLLLAEAAGDRLVPMPDDTAEYWLIWTMRLADFAAVGWFGLDFIHQSGLSDTAFAGLLKAYGLALTGLLAMLILQNRESVARALGGQADGSAIARLRFHAGRLWYVAALIYLVGSYFVWAADVPGGFAFLLRASAVTVVLLLTARVLDLTLTHLTRRFLSIGRVLEARFPGLQNRANLYAPLLLGVARGLIYGLGLVVALDAWDLHLLSILETQTGLRILGAGLTMGMTLALAAAVWEAVSLAIALYLLRPGADGKPPARSARMRTLLPLFRKTFALVLGVIVVLISLAGFGVNIAPLLAGAGIAGIAVGFGAQSLVKDVITGISILIQDAVSVGDWVNVAGNFGQVEQISIRSIRLRDMSGTMMMVPFSEVSTVKNLTKEYSYAVFEIGVAYREDVDEVMAVVAELAATMQAEEAHAWRILRPMEILGLDAFGDSAVMLKARMMTVPGQQWVIKREFNRRMKRRFDELGIEMPFPHQTLYFGEDKSGQAPPARVRIAEAEPTPRP